MQTKESQITGTQLIQGLTGVLASCLIWLSGCTTLLSPIIGESNPHLLLGKPSPATSFNAKDYLVLRPQYALSYNRDKGTANWASWQLNETWLGNLPRSEFTTDGSLPQGWYQVSPGDYTGSGFDRGHLVPAADRNQTAADSQAVFLMTNILPQAPDNNQGPWERLESHCRELVRQGKELYIIAGRVGAGGNGLKGSQAVIGKGRISVPAQLWKIVVILDRPGLGIGDITEDTPVIAVMMPNRQGIKGMNWRNYQTTIDQIEQQTGYDFLANVPDPIQSKLESKSGLSTMLRSIDQLEQKAE
ncbi:MAG: DNA/RNA non-specific endonuclease [Elainella sp. Prado103]|nr:DNA/RNA non-specific endonuclease [Elainella sp. Prado103]